MTPRMSETFKTYKSKHEDEETVFLPTSGYYIVLVPEYADKRRLALHVYRTYTDALIDKDVIADGSIRLMPEGRASFAFSDEAYRNLVPLVVEILEFFVERNDLQKVKFSEGMQNRTLMRGVYERMPGVVEMPDWLQNPGDDIRMGDDDE